MTERLDPTLVAEIVAARMESFGVGWAAVGDEAVGPGTLAVHVADHHEVGPNHIDLGFVLNRDHDTPTVIWDCAAGIGDSTHQIAERAVETWAVCTAPVVYELLTQTGEYAAHYPEDDPLGITGWHCIHGPILGFGKGQGPETMQQWVLDHPLLPVLGDVLADGFDRPLLNGIKFVFGGDIAEVRINGDVNPTATAALYALDYPRLDPFAFARCFVLAVHGPDDRAVE